jgi:chemotaxis protein MotB
MRTITLSGVFLAGVCLALISGCNEELEDCKMQNRALDAQRKKLSSDLEAAKLRIANLNNQFDHAQKAGSIDVEALRKEIEALEDDLAKKKNMIASMRGQLLGGAPLPIELSTMLEDFAKVRPKMVEYDPNRGIVKFKSDLLFERGSDTVAANAAKAITALCEILNSDEGKQFDIVVAGHTDDIPIRKPDTLQKHPDNWNLSAHRAISVLKIMAKNNVDSKRMSARGFGEFRPVIPNRPNKGGHPRNRRVEIYIVPKGK